MIVGFPPRCDFGRPWHEVLHDAHQHALPLAERAGIKPFSQVAMAAVWRWAGRVAGMPDDRWAKRLLAWDPHHGWVRHAGAWKSTSDAAGPAPIYPKKFGRPFLRWRDCIDRFWRSCGRQDSWLCAAEDAHAWRRLEGSFLTSLW